LAQIMEILGDVGGVEREDVNAAMNSVEFRLRDTSSKRDRQPRGIMIFQMALNK